MERGSSRAGYNRSAKLRTLYFIIIVVYRANLANLGSSARAHSRQHSSEPSAGVPSRRTRRSIISPTGFAAAPRTSRSPRCACRHFTRFPRHPPVSPRRDTPATPVSNSTRAANPNRPRGRVGSSSASSSTAESSALAFGSRPSVGRSSSARRHRSGRSQRRVSGAVACDRSSAAERCKSARVTSATASMAPSFSNASTARTSSGHANHPSACSATTPRVGRRRGDARARAWNARGTRRGVFHRRRTRVCRVRADFRPGRWRGAPGRASGRAGTLAETRGGIAMRIRRGTRDACVSVGASSRRPRACTARWERREGTSPGEGARGGCSRADGGDDGEGRATRRKLRRCRPRPRDSPPDRRMRARGASAERPRGGDQALAGASHGSPRTHARVV